jgi:hypothetical protein
MYDRHRHQHKRFATLVQNSSLLLQTEKRGVNNKLENVSKVYKNQPDKNVKTKGNKIPTEYRYVFWILIGDQGKWNKVFDKVIAAIDRCEKQSTIVVNEVQVK